MTKRKDRWKLAILAVCISMLAAFPAFASEKTISSVTLKIDSDLEAGDTLPGIDYTNDSSGSASNGSVLVINTSSKYSITDAEWVTSTSKTMTVGYQPEMKVTLTPNDEGDTEYQFKGTYRSSNVTIRSGTFVSATKKSGDLVIKLKVKALEGTFEPPEDVHWKDNAKGTAKWEESDEGDTGKYEVVLRRGNTTIHTVETTSHSYNFYPYMTREGTYTFRVRTIASTSKEEDYGKHSEWVESDEIYLAEEDVSDGSGQTGNGASAVQNGSAGWINSNNSWYYYYPDGSYQKEGWAQVAGKWYLFQSDGRMVTGWQNSNNQTYYLSGSGDMVTGWVSDGGKWYYLNPTQDAYLGCMLRSRWLDVNGKTYYLTSTGAMAEGWTEADGNWYYFYPGSGEKAVNTWIDTFYVDENGVWKR